MRRRAEVVAKPGMLVMSRPVHTHPTLMPTTDSLSVDTVDEMRMLDVLASIDRKGGLPVAMNGGQANMEVITRPARLKVIADQKWTWEDRCKQPSTN